MTLKKKHRYVVVSLVGSSGRCCFKSRKFSDDVQNVSPVSVVRAEQHGGSVDLYGARGSSSILRKILLTVENLSVPLLLSLRFC